MALAIAIVALLVAIYAAVVSKNANNAAVNLADALQSVSNHQPQDPRLRTLED